MQRTNASPAPYTRMASRYVVEMLPALLTPFFGILAALVIMVVILQLQGADPITTWEYLYEGTLETAQVRADLVAFWMPLAITSFGLVLTYNAGLWNIGVEGQIIAGAIGATWAVRIFTSASTNPLDGLDLFRLLGVLLVFVALVWNGLHLFAKREDRRLWFSGLVLLLVAAYVGFLLLEVVLRKLGVSKVLIAFLFAAAAGGLWSGLAGVLKTRGGVNEIFGGVALNFIVGTFNAYLVTNSGPWQLRTSTATTTDVFPPEARLTTYKNFNHLSLTPIYITIGAFVVVFVIMYVLRWGLQLRAMGKNQRSAFLLGVRTERNVVLSMMMCGMMAGIAGAFRVLGPFPTRAKLTNDPSGGIGFLAILVVLLASMSIVLTPLVSFVFAMLSKGGVTIERRFQSEHDLTLHQSLVSVLQSTIVLMVVLAIGVRNRFFPPRAAPPDDEQEIDRT